MKSPHLQVHEDHKEPLAIAIGSDPAFISPSVSIPGHSKGISRPFRDVLIIRQQPAHHIFNELLSLSAAIL
jgi:hypothetical protein